jgi:hypothetical protein
VGKIVAEEDAAAGKIAVVGERRNGAVAAGERRNGAVAAGREGMVRWRRENQPVWCGGGGGEKETSRNKKIQGRRRLAARCGPRPITLTMHAAPRSAPAVSAIQDLPKFGAI